jgi:hypothetical protein
MNFLDAKKIVSPDSPVVPGSKEHKEILNLMRQSGRVFAEDNVPAVPIPLLAPMVGVERKFVSTTPTPTSKNMMKKPQLLEVVKKSSAYAKPEYYFVAGGKSKLECKKIKVMPLIITDGSDERRAEVQAPGEVEGRTGESQGSS